MNKRCHYCHEFGHITRECKREKYESTLLRKYIGYFFEKFICDNFSCPKCSGELIQLAGDIPSLDLICLNCEKIFEVKSKCLSSKIIPNDINIKHGNSEMFEYRINNEGLDMILIIYGVNRITKNLIMRKICYIENYDLLNSNNIKIMYDENSHCNISIMNLNKIQNIQDKKYQVNFYNILSDKM